MCLTLVLFYTGFILLMHYDNHLPNELRLNQTIFETLEDSGSGLFFLLAGLSLLRTLWNMRLEP